MIDVKFPDDSILEEFRRLGEVALANFFDRHRQELHRLVRLRLDRRISRRVDTSDILQEAYFESCSRLEAYLRSPQIPPMAWIRRLARQVIARVQREHMETQKRDVRREMNGGELSRASLYDLSDAITPPIAKAARKELQQKNHGLGGRNVLVGSRNTRFDSRGEQDGSRSLTGTRYPIGNGQETVSTSLNEA